MPKVNLLRNIPTHTLISMIPPHLRVLVDIDSIKEDKISVALFSTDNKYVTTSAEAKKIVDQTDSLKPLVAVGWAFTEEAAQILEKNADYYFYREAGFWTDQSYHEMRQNNL